MRKLIGIVGGLLDQTNRLKGFGLNAAYVEYFNNFGDVIVIDPRAETVFPVDLLVLPGGADIDTVRYNQAPSIFTGRPNPFLEYFDRVQLPKYIQACSEGKLSIWGTCRGSQSLAVYFGVPLVQHIEQEYSSPRSKFVDKVRLIEETQPDGLELPRGWFSKMSQINLLEINSIHHQGYMLEDFENTNLLPLAYNIKEQPDTGQNNVEFFRHKTLNIAAGQHHSEECYDPYSEILINWLLDNNKKEQEIFNVELEQNNQ